MSWKDKLLPASFRGVPFGVSANTRTGGRAAGVHTYPLRDKPFVEDLGRIERRFSVDAFIVGDDYAATRDRLIDRLESPGPGFPSKPAGTLVHPTYGTLRVLCTNFRVSESLDEGRMARVSMDFVEAGEELQPSGRSQHVDRADAAAAVSASEAARKFEDEVEVAGVIEEVRAPLGSGLRELASRIGALDVFGGRSTDVAAVTDQLGRIVRRTSELITAPADLVGAVQSMLRGVVASAGNAFGALTAYQTLFDFPSPTIPGTGGQASQANANAAALRALIVEQAVSGAVRAGARASFPTLEDALEARDAVTAKLDELSATADTQAHFALEALRQVFIDAVPPAERDLPRLRTITLPRNRPALVLAWELYDDAERDAELVDRNRIAHPLRLPGNVALQALTS